MKTAKLATILFATMAFGLLSTATLTVKAQASMTTDKADYSPGDIVTVTGSGFTPGESYAIPVIRPDGSIVTIDEYHTATPGWDIVTADESSGFIYFYQLDGIEGTYEVRVYPSIWARDLSETPVAWMTFTDAPPLPQADLQITDFTSTNHSTFTFGWTIDKSVIPNSWDLFTGDSGTSNYTLTLTKDSGTYTAAWITGSISVKNTGNANTVNLAIVVNVTDGVPPPNDLVNTTNVDVSSNSILVPNEIGTYSYSIIVPVANIHTGTNAVYQVHAYAMADGTKSNDSDLNPFTDPFATPTLINDEVHVTDTNGGAWTFSASGSVSYLKTFTAGDAGDNTNTATITETEQSDDATVTVNVYNLGVTKDAGTSFTRTYEWSINKTADQTELHLSTGQSSVVHYSVEVNSTGYTDSDWAVAGNITIYNPAPIAANITSISDIVSQDIAGTVDFGSVTFPYILPAETWLNGTYSASLLDASTRTNTANVTLQNYDFNYDGTNSTAGVTYFSGTASVDFSDATITEGDKSVTVSDTYAGTLGTLTYGVVTLPHAYTYSRTVGPYITTGERDIDNTASVMSDSTTLTSDDWEVVVYVEGTQFCAVTSKGYQDIDTFKLIFTPDVPTYPGYSRLTASNPGQFSFNVFCDIEDGDVVTISIPYPFVTQGTNPVHIYTGVSGNNPTGTDITSQFGLSGIPWLMTDWGTSTDFTDTHEITITSEGYTGPMYVTIHLDYGLKKVAGDYGKNLDLDALHNGGSLYGNILNNQPYVFSVSNSYSGSDSVSNVNVFKNDPGIGGLVLDSDGNPMSGVAVKISCGSGKTAVSATVYTDEDGWYMWNYKWTGKAATFTIKLPDYGLQQDATLKANGFLIVNFTTK